MIQIAEGVYRGADVIHYNVDEMLDSQGMARTNRNRHAMHLAIKNITAVENPDQDINITWSNS